jgi:hypothetical protein
MAAFRLAHRSPKDSYRLCKKYDETKEEAKAQHKAVEPLMNEYGSV